MFLTRAKEQERINALLGALASGQVKNGKSEAGHSQSERSVRAVLSIDELCFRAGLSSGLKDRYLLLGFSGTLMALLMFMSRGNASLLLIAPLAWWLVYMSLKRKAVQRAENFEKDYTALLLSLASAVRTGLDPLAALTQAGQFFQDKCEVANELETLKKNVDSGMSEDEAVINFAASIDHPDIALFRTAFILARREGSGLAGCLQRLARVTRARQSFRRKVRSAVAMQRLSAFGIVACTLVIGTIQWVTNPAALKLAWQDPFGFKLLGLGIGLVFCGLGWMLMLTRTRL